MEEELPPTTELEEGLRNGVYLAKLAKFFAPNVVSDKKIYDVEQARYKVITFSVLSPTRQKNVISVFQLLKIPKHGWLTFCISFVRLSELNGRQTALTSHHDKSGMFYP